MEQPDKIKLWYSFDMPVEYEQPTHAVMPLQPEDYEEVGRTFLDAYRGTIDYEGEELTDAIQEVHRVCTGAYGALIHPASGVIMVEHRIAAAVFVTEQPDGTAFIPYLVTAKEWKGQGFASELLRHALFHLANAGYKRVELYVTRGNLIAEHLYAKLGFLSAE
ncbi:MAG: GNAT family N-acetyltransferase [Candidatus Kapaibacterium sp.]